MGVKKSTLKELNADLVYCQSRIADVKERGDAAICGRDLKMGYNADFYLKSGMLKNHVDYARELVDKHKDNNTQQELFKWI